MDVTGRIRRLEKIAALIHLNTHPVSYGVIRYNKLIIDAQKRGVDLSPWTKRLVALRKRLGLE